MGGKRADSVGSLVSCNILPLFITLSSNEDPVAFEEPHAEDRGVSNDPRLSRKLSSECDTFED